MSSHNTVRSVTSKKRYIITDITDGGVLFLVYVLLEYKTKLSSILCFCPMDCTGKQRQLQQKRQFIITEVCQNRTVAWLQDSKENKMHGICNLPCTICRVLPLPCSCMAEFSHQTPFLNEDQAGFLLHPDPCSSVSMCCQKIHVPTTQFSLYCKLLMHACFSPGCLNLFFLQGNLSFC